METKLIKIHATYIISILLAIIVLLLSVKWAKISGLVEYITFALTLSSLILAVLAIVYSMVSNNSFNNIIHSLNFSSKQLESASEGINESNRILLKEIRRIPDAIDNVDKNVSSTRMILENLSLKDAIKSDADVLEPTKLNDNVIKSFLLNSPIRGLQSLYCMVLSYNTKTAFKWDEISQDIISLKKSGDYLRSYSIATKAFGIIIYEYDGKSRLIVKDIHQVIRENILEILTRKLEEAAKESSEYSTLSEEEERKYWLRSPPEIEKYFGIVA